MGFKANLIKNAVLLGFFGVFTLLALPLFAQEKPLQVVASFSVLGDMVKQVGGDAVNVKTLVGPDADTHTYQPTPDDARALAGADVIFVNGLGFEGWMDRLISASGTKARIVVASKGVKAHSMIDEDEGGKKVTDPHAWQNPANGRLYVKNIASALEAMRPAQAQAIAARAKAYDAEIARTDASVKKEISAVSKSQRKIITSHDAFGYFGSAYGVTFLAPVGLSTESEASASGIAKLIAQIKKEGVKTVFIENMSNPRIIEQIARESGAQMGGTLYSDALSGPAGPAPTYLDMFKNNVPKLVAAMKQNKK